MSNYLIIKAISDYADKKFKVTRHRALFTLLTKMYSFVICYLNNTLATNSNLSKQGLNNFTKYDIYDENRTLEHVVGICKTELQKKLCFRDMKLF